MLARIRKSMDEKDQGFTLIELLVVMIIIGILAAIAIPVFLNQRKKAVDSSIKSDLRTVANQEETNFTDTQAYVKIAALTATPTIGSAVKLSPNNQILVLLNAGGDGYCVQGHNASDSHDWVYESDNGGLQPAATVACPASYS